MKRYFKLAVLTTIVLSLTGCGGQSVDVSKPGGYILLGKANACTLRAVQSQEAGGTKNISATQCVRKQGGGFSALVASCGELQFTSGLLPGGALRCTNCDLLAGASAGCELRMPQLPDSWQTVSSEQ